MTEQYEGTAPIPQTPPPTAQVVQPATKTVAISLWTAMGVLGASILGTMVVTAFAIGSNLNTDHFLLQSTVTAVDELRDNTVRQDVFTQTITPLKEDINEIKDTTKNTNLKLDLLLNREQSSTPSRSSVVVRTTPIPTTLAPQPAPSNGNQAGISGILHRAKELL